MKLVTMNLVDNKVCSMEMNEELFTEFEEMMMTHSETTECKVLIPTECLIGAAEGLVLIESNLYYYVDSNNILGYEVISC